MHKSGLVGISEKSPFTATGGLHSIPSAKLPGTLAFILEWICLDSAMLRGQAGSRDRCCLQADLCLCTVSFRAESVQCLNVSGTRTLSLM